MASLADRPTDAELHKFEELLSRLERELLRMSEVLGVRTTPQLEVIRGGKEEAKVDG